MNIPLPAWAKARAGELTSPGLVANALNNGDHENPAGLGWVPLPPAWWIEALKEEVATFLSNAHETPVVDDDLTPGELAFVDFLVDSYLVRHGYKPAVDRVASL